MSYEQTKYVNEVDVERVLQYEITESTKPSSVQVNNYIQDVEKEIDARLLGWGDTRKEGEGYLATDVYLDVILQPSHILIARTLEALLYRRLLLTAVNVQLDRFFPAIKVVSLARRLTGITDNPTWESLTEGWYPGWVETANADYMCERAPGRAGQHHIMKIMVFGGRRPEAGYARVKATLWYGWNLPLRILKQWGSYKVANKVLEDLALSGEPTRLGSYVKGNFQEYTNISYDHLIAANNMEAERIEEKYFPKYPYEAAAVLRI